MAVKKNVKKVTTKAVSKVKVAAPKSAIPKKTKVKKLSVEECMAVLNKAMEDSVSKTLHRYQNGPLSSIFNESEMRALAQDTAIEVGNRVQLYYQKADQKNSVNPRGMVAYFKTAFIRRTMKIYEKHAKTDTRAGVQTISSEEAMAVASNRNFFNPENNYILQNQLQKLVSDLQEADTKYNNDRRIKALNENRTVSSDELQHSAIIIEKSLAGFEANEIRDFLKLSTVDYARHRREALDLAKSKMDCSLDDLCEHLEVAIDYRVLSREVKKRKKPKNRVMNYSTDCNFYTQTTLLQGKTYKTSLFVRIDFKEGDERIKDLPSVVEELESVTGPVSDSINARKILNEKVKTVEISSKIKSLADEHLNKLKAKNKPQKTA